MLTSWFLFLAADYPIIGLSANSRIHHLIRKVLSKTRILTPFLSIVDKYHHFWASRNTWTLICTSGYDIDWFWPQTSVKRYNCTHVCYPSGILLPRSLFWIFWWKFRRAGNLPWIPTHQFGVKYGQTCIHKTAPAFRCLDGDSRLKAIKVGNFANWHRIPWISNFTY